MGKDKNAPRTKGNQKPSSSVRSAELLGGLKGNGAFLGFGAAGGYSSARAAHPESDHTITDGFRLALRKMAKKDSVTKVKALQEFDELLKSEELASTETALPFWPRIYCKLSIDTEKKVREWAQVCQGRLASKVGKAMAPYLKSLVPTWLLAMTDPYPAAAAAASRAFKEVFAEDKRPGVLFLCAKEIFDFVSDNLFQQTADSLSDPKTSTAVEREEKYTRVLCCSLAAVAEVQRWTKSRPNYDSQLLPHLQQLLQQELFWKLHKHPNVKVRCSFFDSVSEVVTSGGCDVRAATLAIRAGLSDADATVLPHAYSSLIHLAATHEECWEELGDKSCKPLSERLLRLLKERCRGVATEVLPLLLPLLAVLPRSALTQPEQFYLQLLQQLYASLQGGEELSNRQEASALLRTLFECTKLINKDGQFDPDFWNKIMGDLISGVFELALTTSKQLMSEAVYEEIVSLSQFWIRHQLDSGALDVLWRSCFQYCQNAVSSRDPTRLQQLLLFLQTLRCPQRHTKSKKSGVKFRESNTVSPVENSFAKLSVERNVSSTEDSRKNSLSEDSTDKESNPSAEPRIKNAKEETTSRDHNRVQPEDLDHKKLAHELQRIQSFDSNSKKVFLAQFSGNCELIKQLVAQSYRLYKEEDECLSTKFLLLNVFVELVSTFKDIEPYNAVLTDDSCESCYDFVKKALVPLLRYPDYAAQQPLTKLLHELLITLTDVEQIEALACILKSSCVEATRAFLECIVVYRHGPSKVLADWLSSAPLGSKLVTLLKEALAINIALAHEQQEIKQEEEQRRKKKNKRKESRADNENDSADNSEENEEMEAIENAKTQRGHLIALFQMVLSGRVEVGATTGTGHLIQFSGNYVSQILTVLYSALPHELHTDCHKDTAHSTVANVEFIVQLCSTVFSSSSCWQLQHSSNLLLALFVLLCPSDVLLAPLQTSDDEEPEDVMKNCILPDKLIARLRSVAFGAFELLAITAASSPSGQEDKEVKNAKEKLKHFLDNVLKHIKTVLSSPSCSYAATAHLAAITSQCLLIVAAASSDQDCDIPLDVQSVRDALTLLLPSEGALALWETQMCHDYLVPTALVGSCSFRKCEIPTTLQDAVGGDIYCRTAFFLSSLLLQLCGDCTKGGPELAAAVPPSDGVSADSEPGLGEVEALLTLLEGEESVPVEQHGLDVDNEGEQQVSLGPFCRLVCVCIHAAYYLDTVVALRGALNLDDVTPSLRATATALCSNTLALLGRVNRGNLQQMSKILRDLACESDAGLWCVTLRRFLARWHTRISASRLLLSVDPAAFNATPVRQVSALVRQVLLQYVPVSELLPLLGSEVAKIQSLSDDPFSGSDALVVAASVLLRCPTRDCGQQVQAIMDVLLQWWTDAPTAFLFAEDMDSSGSRSEDVSVVVKVATVVRVVVQHHAHHLTSLHWERLLCVLTSWVQSLGDSAQSLDDSSVLTSLLCCVARCVAAVEGLVERLQGAPAAERSQFPEKLCEEWEEFFCSFLHSVLLPLHCRTADRYVQPKCRSVLLYCTCRALCLYAVSVPARELSKHALPPLHHPQDDNLPLKLPDHLQVLLNHLCAGLLCPHPTVTGTSHAMLVRSLPEVMQWLVAAAADDKDAANSESLALPNVLIRVIKQCGTIVSTALEERPMFGEQVVVVLPHTDSHTYVLAYCLAWYAAFTALLACPEDNRPLFASELRNGDLLPLLLTTLVKLIPPEHQLPARCRGSRNTDTSSMLTVPLDLLLPQECGTSYTVWWLSCQLYRQSLSLFPYWVRTWYHAQTKKNADIINTMTSLHFSPLVIAEELAAIREFRSSDVTVRVRSQREVVAVYRIEESDLELTLQLPRNLPLAPASMVHSEHSGVSTKLWEGWKNGLKTVLSYQNSPLIASLKVWKQNLDQKYQGVEPCYICYCIMHMTSRTLPASQCRTCKKKFHSACLYQWFVTSPRLSCPLCRSVW
ncbi:Armadillo-type fold [Trinorchestia longiramus]|nr:Armadillo-type fold [Trinorchestia longiramus]